MAKQITSNDDFDTDQANELYLYILSDGNLYRQRRLPIYQNLSSKMKKGIYDPKLAVKLFMYLVDDAAKKYGTEFELSNKERQETFTKSVRLDVAEAFARKFESDFKNKEYDFMQDSYDMKLKNIAPQSVKENGTDGGFTKGYKDGYKAGHADNLLKRDEPSRIALSSNIPGYSQGYNDGYYNLENYAEKSEGAKAGGQTSAQARAHISKRGCEYCLNRKIINAGVINGTIFGRDLQFEYDAPSVDSSFSGREASFEINFCPFCGAKINEKNEGSGTYSPSVHFAGRGSGRLVWEKK